MITEDHESFGAVSSGRRMTALQNWNAKTIAGIERYRKTIEATKEITFRVKACVA